MRPVEAPETIRQSLLAQLDRCPLSTRFAMESELRQPSWLAARGTLAHRFFAQALRHMYRNREGQIPVDVSMEILAEIIAQRDVPDDQVVHLPLSELRWLRVLATKFAYGHSYTVERVWKIEGQDPWEDEDYGRHALEATIPVRGPGGTEYERTISGQLDVLLAEPPDGAVVVDYKTGFAPAPEQREKRDADPTAERQDTLSDVGYAQQVVYGFLVLANYPSVEWVALREFYVMSGEVREARIYRWEMERITDILAGLVAQFDAAVESEVRLREEAIRENGGEIPDVVPHSQRFFPIPGPHCGYCPRAIDCPIRDEVGIPATEEEAVALAREWIQTGEVRKERRKLLGGWIDARGPLIIHGTKGRTAVGWVPSANGQTRSFRVYRPEDAPESPFDVAPTDSDGLADG